jgi:hypothetical protein
MRPQHQPAHTAWSIGRCRPNIRKNKRPHLLDATMDDHNRSSKRTKFVPSLDLPPFDCTTIHMPFIAFPIFDCHNETICLPLKTTRQHPSSTSSKSDRPHRPQNVITDINIEPSSNTLPLFRPTPTVLTDLKQKSPDSSPQRCLTQNYLGTPSHPTLSLASSPINPSTQHAGSSSSSVASAFSHEYFLIYLSFTDPTTHLPTFASMPIQPSTTCQDIVSYGFSTLHIPTTVQLHVIFSGKVIPLTTCLQSLFISPYTFVHLVYRLPENPQTDVSENADHE